MAWFLHNLMYDLMTVLKRCSNMLQLCFGQKLAGFRVEKASVLPKTVAYLQQSEPAANTMSQHGTREDTTREVEEANQNEDQDQHFAPTDDDYQDKDTDDFRYQDINDGRHQQVGFADDPPEEMVDDGCH